MCEMNVRVRWSRGAVLPVLTRSDATANELSRLLRFACPSPIEEIVFLHNGIPLNPEVSLEMQMIREDDILDAVIVRKISDTNDPKHISNNNSLISKIDSIVLEASKISDRQYNSLEIIAPSSSLEVKHELANITNISRISKNSSSKNIRNNKTYKRANSDDDSDCLELLYYDSLYDYNHKSTDDESSDYDYYDDNTEDGDIEESNGDVNNNTLNNEVQNSELTFDQKTITTSVQNVDKNKEKRSPATEPLPIFWSTVDESELNSPDRCNEPTKMLSIEGAGQYFEKHGSSWVW